MRPRQAVYAAAGDSSRSSGLFTPRAPRFMTWVYTMVLAVWWSPGQKDVKRGPKGETIWETTEEVGWKVHLVDWSDMADDMRPTEKLHGVEVWFLAYGRENIAEVVVDHNNGKYVVSERAI